MQVGDNSPPVENYILNFGFSVVNFTGEIHTFIFYKRNVFRAFMKVKGRHFETIWINRDNTSLVQIIDQRYLPFTLRIEDISTAGEMFIAIRDMHLRGAPLIGAAGALGMYLAAMNQRDGWVHEDYVDEQASYLKSARPTAINLNWAVDKVVKAIKESGTKGPWPGKEVVDIARQEALQVMDEERTNSFKIGQHGLKLLEELSIRKNGNTINILTHCNAGWLACIDYGTATAPIYLAHDRGIKVHVWVDETRPRNQGARLTAWELRQHGVPCTVIADNTGGHLMQQGLVDMVIVGCDRASPYGDIVNKIGTYLKALAARDNHVPFYAALPSSTIDWDLRKGARETPIEERAGDELRLMEGMSGGAVSVVEIFPEDVPSVNYGFDITPARLVTGIITERGISFANKKSIFTLFPEKN
jgi:methylthioribose-1-phosphate isomerase